MTKTLINPINNEPVGKEATERIVEAREARRGAKAHARSGNPSKRIPAQKMLRERVFSQFIVGVLRRDAQ